MRSASLETSDRHWDALFPAVLRIPAIATCLIGVFAGLLLKNERFTAPQKSLLLVGAGIVTVAAGHLWGSAISDNEGDLDLVIRRCRMSTLKHSTDLCAYIFDHSQAA